MCPPLFSIDILNDMVNACDLSKPYLFADNGALLFVNISGKTYYLSIRIEMLTNIKWLSVNKLSLNTYTTKILIFDKSLLSVKINIGSNYAIKEFKSFKFLGLIEDNLLIFDFHVDYIKKKIH